MAFTKAPVYILTDAEYLLVQQTEAELTATKLQLKAAQDALAACQVTSAIKIAALEAQITQLTADLSAMTAERDSLATQVTLLQTQVTVLQAKLDALQPPPPSLPIVPFKIPPLLLNGNSSGSDNIATAPDKLVITVSQNAQPAHVLRRDYGIQKPGTTVKTFEREPVGRNRKYSLKVTVPANYNPVEMNNLWQLHTHSAQMSPYLAFFLWTTTSRWRHIKPDGSYVDYNKQPIKKGFTYLIEVAAKWSQGADGYIQGWENGMQVMDYKGPTYRIDESEGPYLLWGQYYPSVDVAFSNTMEFAEFRRGDA